MSRARVKLDLGPHGKVLASVTDYDDCKAVASSRFEVEPSQVQLYVSDGEDLWELHPSAFHDVVAENGVIVAKALLQPSSTAHPRLPVANSSAAAGVTKHDAPLGGPASSTQPSTTPTVESGPSRLGLTVLPTTPSSSSRGIARPRASSVSSTTSTSSDSSTSTSSSASSSSSGSSSSSSPSNDARRSESVQDVTASSATVRTIIGPNGLPVSSKERWDPKTHRLMFEKLNDIINSETIYYTRKYTEERYRIFQLLIDQYGDMGVKGNFLRGRTAAALISRVAGVLRTARERGEKVKQPFKFFFPNKKDDDVAPRSATAPTTAGPSRTTSHHPNGDGARAQTLPASANGQPNKRKSKAARAAAARAAAAATEIAASVQSTTLPPAVTAPSGSPSQNVTPNGRGGGKGKGPAQGTRPAERTAGGQSNPPEIRRNAAKAAAVSRRPPSPARAAKRPANGAPTTQAPQSKQPNARNKQKAPPQSTQQPRPTSSNQHQHRGTIANESGGPSSGDAPRRAASSSRRSRSASPRPIGGGDRSRYDEDERYERRADRSSAQSPRRQHDPWRARDESPDGHDEVRKPPRRRPASLPRRPSWTDTTGRDYDDHGGDAAITQSDDRRSDGDHRSADGPLFRAETRSPAPNHRRSPRPRKNNGNNGNKVNNGNGRRDVHPPPQSTSNVQSSPTRRRNAVERALEHLISAGADVTSLPQSGTPGRQRQWGSPHRTWQQGNGNENGASRSTPDLRQTAARNHHEQQQQRQEQHQQPNQQRQQLPNQQRQQNQQHHQQRQQNQHRQQQQGRRRGSAAADNGRPSPSMRDADRFELASPRTPPRDD